jgi:hypothetical protein
MTPHTGQLPTPDSQPPISSVPSGRWELGVGR